MLCLLDLHIPHPCLGLHPLPHAIPVFRNLPKALCLIASIGALGNHRFYTPADIGGAGLTQGTPQARVLQAILQNTLEQVVTAVLVQGAWAVLMPSRWQGAVGAASCLFVLGRVMFWRGYAAGAGSRAFGFGCTFYPSLMMVLVMAVHLAVSAVD